MPQNPGRVIALGFFDGVHLGHGALLRRVAEAAVRTGARPCAFTFDQHPSGYILGRSVPLLSTPQDREWLMRRYYGVEELIVGRFEHMMTLPWQDFVARYLKEELQAVHVVAGHDFHFGYRGEGNPRRLSQLCRELGMGCDIVDRVERDGITVSSTYIRTLVAQGELERAADFLGHPHLCSGTVIHGKQLGRTIGFPTANLAPDPGLLTPKRGVYATRVLLPDGQRRLAVTNVGTRPTVEDGEALTVEPWLLDFDGDLYGKTIRVEFFCRLREEKRFDSLEALTAAVMENARQTRAYFAGRT